MDDHVRADQRQNGGGQIEHGLARRRIAYRLPVTESHAGLMTGRGRQGKIGAEKWRLGRQNRLHRALNLPIFRPN